MSRYVRCADVEAVARMSGMPVRYRVHLCFSRRATLIERRVRAVELQIERTALPAEFLDWLATDAKHEEELARWLSWDAFGRYSGKDVSDFTPLAVSLRLMGRN